MPKLLIPESELPAFAKRLRSQAAFCRRAVQQQEKRLNRAKRAHPGSPFVLEAVQALATAREELAKLENDAKAVEAKMAELG